MPDLPLPPRAEPFFFGPVDRPRAGWLHRSRPSSSTGVVVCNPFGYEAICGHRTLRHLAEALAAVGASTLRFDYDGTGDSAGDDGDSGRLDAWVESTREACQTLRELCGVEHVWLVGLRLGALVAGLAAADVNAAGLVAIAPVVSGRAYLRELAVYEAALDRGAPPPGQSVEDVLGVGGQETLGFGFTPETRKTLSEIDLSKLARPLASPSRTPPFEVLVLDRDDLPAAGKWVAHLGAQTNVRCEAQRLPGYVEMIGDPQGPIPDAIVRAATSFVSARLTPRVETEQQPQAGRCMGENSRSHDVSPHPAAHEALRSEAQLGAVVERFVIISRARIFGVLASSASLPRSGRAVILVNAGAIHHVGPNRLYVKLARRWAAAGHDVLRVDLTGIGESPTRLGETENVVYSARALDDLAVAVEWLRCERAPDDIRAVGLCSGGYHAMKAAREQQLKGFVALNPLTFLRGPQGPTTFPAYRVAREAERYQRAARDPEKWKKLLRGEVKIRPAAETLARHAATKVADRARELARQLHIPLKDDFGVELRSNARRKIDQRFIFASADPGNQLLKDQTGSTLTSLQKRGDVVIATLDGCDHTFTPIWSHDPLVELVTEAITPRRSANNVT